MSQTPTLRAGLQSILDDLTDDMHTCMPGVVVSYSNTSQTASVQPALKREYTNERDERIVERHPVIQHVPIVFPGAGGFSVTFPIAAGDVVLLLFASGSLDKWLDTGGEVDPEDTRRFCLSDAVAIPGLRSRRSPVGLTGVSSSAMVINGDAVHLGGPGVFLSGPTGDGLVTERAIDPFTGQTQAILNAPAITTKVKAK